MMARPIKPILLIGMSLLLLLSACKSSAAQLTPISNSPTVANTSQSYPLATPYALEPAAGICASPDTQTVVVTINPDMPDPRCSKVRADQTLTVVNKTLNTLQVSIGNFSSSLLPGAEYSIDVPFGSYLEPGVHQLTVTPCCGAELWLEASK